jgi:hypothetical protein
MSRQPTNDQVVFLIERWLVEESDNWKYDKIEDPSSYMNMRIQSANARNIHVQMDGIHNRLFFIAKMSPTEGQSKAYSLQPRLDKRRLSSNLLILLFQLGIAASISNSLENKIEDIVLQKLIYFDALTKDRFFDSLYSILRGIETIQSVFNTLADIPDDNQSLK